LRPNALAPKPQVRNLRASVAVNSMHNRPLHGDNVTVNTNGASRCTTTPNATRTTPKVEPRRNARIRHEPTQRRADLAANVEP